MKIEKIINNNVISSLDDQGIEVVVMGRGIGFQKKSGECIDKDKIDKIFYMENDDERNKFQKLIANLPIEHIQISNEDRKSVV